MNGAPPSAEDPWAPYDNARPLRATPSFSQEQSKNQVSNQQKQAVSRPPKKSSKRRKRHCPPGPAGVLFQTQRHLKKQKPTGEAPSINPENDSNKRNDSRSVEDISSCSAWMHMQKSLGLTTPFLPAYYSASERYESLRQHLPSGYALIHEINQGLHDLCLNDKLLVVLVHSIRVHGHYDWTVELRDECGDRIRAWVDPTLVQKEQEESKYVRIGVVWCLCNASMAILSEDTKAQDALPFERMLLVSESRISDMWTSHGATSSISDTDFLNWMQERSTLFHGDDGPIEQASPSQSQFDPMPARLQNVANHCESDVEDPESSLASFEDVLPLDRSPQMPATRCNRSNTFSRTGDRNNMEIMETDMSRHSQVGPTQSMQLSNVGDSHFETAAPSRQDERAEGNVDESYYSPGQNRRTAQVNDASVIEMPHGHSSYGEASDTVARGELNKVTNSSPRKSDSPTNAKERTGGKQDKRAREKKKIQKAVRAKTRKKMGSPVRNHGKKCTTVALWDFDSDLFTIENQNALDLFEDDENEVSNGTEEAASRTENRKEARAAENDTSIYRIGLFDPAQFEGFDVDELFSED